MKKYFSLFLVAIFFAFNIAGCDGESSSSGDGEYIVDAMPIMLPPGHPGVISGDTMLLPQEPQAPTVRTANCFAGAYGVFDLGIGSVAGVDYASVGYAVLPVNLNLGDPGNINLGSYIIRAESSDSSVEIDIADSSGSNPLLSETDCTLRGCPFGCGSYPENYPPQFDPALGFQKDPDIVGSISQVTITSGDTTDLSQPATGKINLFNLRVNVVSEIPDGGVDLTLYVDELKDTSGTDITANVLSGSIVKFYNLQ